MEPYVALFIMIASRIPAIIATMAFRVRLRIQMTRVLRRDKLQLNYNMELILQ
jgi:hypothetical protein